MAKSEANSKTEAKKTKKLDEQYNAQQNRAGHLEETQQPNPAKYNPSKRLRKIRRRVYERFYEMRDNPFRQAAEEEWVIADAEYSMPDPEIDPEDWQSHLQLPDAFAAIQAQSQEDIERKARPQLRKVDETDEPLQEFGNAILNYNMDQTGFDFQYYLAKLAAAIRGTAFLVDYWRTDKRVVKELTGVDDNGELEFTEKEKIDFDDDFTEWVPNEYVFTDEKAKHIDEAADWTRREILNIDSFHTKYDNRGGFYDTEWVVAGGDTGTRSVFQLPRDMTEQDVEVLHYENRDIDAYWVVANNVTIYDGPLPSRHKELSLSVRYQYRVPGRFWGMGIPKVIYHLTQERSSLRNLNMDRQKIIVGGAFLHNSAFDIDDEDETIYPGRMISVDTGGQPVNQAITQLQMGDVPASYFKTEEILLEDIRRGHGIDDRIQGVNVGGTATEAAILKESALKRVNLINITAEMDCIIRIGRLKWSNIQFFYGAPRMEKIATSGDGDDTGEDAEKIYRSITVKGKKFGIEKDEDGKKKLRMEDIKGASAFALKPEMNKYLESSYDVVTDADVYTPVSKAIEQTKKTEMFSLLMSNPATMALMDLNGATADVLETNNIKPDTWLKTDVSKHDTQMLAEAENMVMIAGQPLSGTENATEDHTMIHLMFTKSPTYQEAPPEFQQLVQTHIFEEHDANPATGKIAQLLGSYGLGGDGGAAAAAIPSMNTPFQTQPGGSAPPQAQTADLQPTNFANPE
jgi:hypothetical protein